ICIIPVPYTVGRKSHPTLFQFFQLPNSTSSTGIVSAQLCLAVCCIKIESCIGDTEVLWSGRAVSMRSISETTRQESWKSLQPIGHHRIKLPLLIQRFAAARIQRCKDPN